jgi:PQQ-like domain/Putative Ig domain
VRDISTPLARLVCRLGATLILIVTAGCGGGGGPGGSPAPPATPAPTGFSYPSPQIYPLGTAIAPLNPAITGVVTSYSSSPALPPGLVIDAHTGIITGTPTAVQPSADYMVTAENSGGSATFSVAIAVATVTASPANISRMVVSSTTVAVALSITAVDFSFSGVLTAKAADTAGVFAGNVTAVKSNGGSALSLTTSPRAPPGHYQGKVTLTLCSDAACTMPQSVPSIAVPYDVYVLSPASAWPGNNLSTLVPWPGVPEWTMFQANAAHTGYVPIDLNPNSFSTRWQAPALDIPVSFGGNLNTLVASNGMLFIGGGTALYARNESDNSAVWSYDFSGLAPVPSVNPPSVAGDVVYVAAGEQSSTFMFAFHAADGTLVFKSPMSSQFEHYLAPTIGPQGIYTNAGTYGGLYGFDTTGQQLFFAFMPQTSQWTPAVDASAIYTYTGDALRVLDPVTGAVNATIADSNPQNFDYEINGSVVLGARGSVFAANYATASNNGSGAGNTLMDFNTTANSIAWMVNGGYANTPAYNAGVLYVTNNNPVRLEARAEADGSLLWSWVPPQAGDTAFVSETLLTNTMIFVSTNLATYGIDTTTHQTVWSYPLVGKLALSRSRILYIEGQQSQTSPSVPGTLTAINVN